MHLEHRLSQWDNKNTEVLTAIYLQQQADPGWTDALVAAIQKEHSQNAASWLIKHSLEQALDAENHFNPQQIDQLLESLPLLHHWSARLHLLQCLPYLRIPPQRKQDVEVFLRDNLKAPNKFVRAWAYNGFGLLAKDYPEYRQEAKRLFDAAMDTEAPSVRARIRKAGKWV
jgi:hypothetical protein